MSTGALLVNRSRWSIKGFGRHQRAASACQQRASLTELGFRNVIEHARGWEELPNFETATAAQEIGKSGNKP